jgi:hypothetical protein
MKVKFSKGYKMASSSVATAGYDVLKQRLGVVFSSGSGYVYDGVSQNVWASWKKSSSRGKYFSENIRSNYAGTEAEISFSTLRNLDESSVIQYTAEDYMLPEDAVSEAWF